MVSFQTVLKFSSLFWGRTDVWYEDTTRATWGHVNIRLFADHLSGARMIGTYPITDEGLVKWGCIDIDDGDLAKALTVQSSWKEYGITSWIERSKSKGYHVWVFPKDWIPAETMRRAGLLILWDSYLDPKTEVNPKQYQLWTEPKPKNAPSWVKHGIGNTVRLPYSPMADQGRMVVLGAQRLARPRHAPLALEAFLGAAGATLAPLRALRAVADRHRALEAHQAHIRASRPIHLEPGIRGPSGAFQRQEAWDILEGTATFNTMRDNQFFTLIQLMKSDRVGYDYGQAEACCRRIYQRQLTDHTDFSWKQVEDKLRRAYQ